LEIFRDSIRLKNSEKHKSKRLLKILDKEEEKETTKLKD